MKKILLYLMLMSQVQCSSSQVTAQNGCDFAALVLTEVAMENARIVKMLDDATDARKVVLVVQQKSGSNLREATLTWMRQNCGKLSSPPSGSFSSDSSTGSSSSGE